MPRKTSHTVHSSAAVRFGQTARDHERTEPSPSDRFGAIARRFGPVAVPTVVAIGTTLFGISHRQLWGDEHATYWAASLSWADLELLLHNADVVIAPYYLFMRGWIALFGDSTSSMRLPSVIAMCAAAAFTAALGRRIFDAATGLTAGLMLAILPAFARYAQEARPYAIAVAATAGGALLVIRARPQSAARWWWLAYAVSVAVAGLAHVVALCVLPAYLVMVLGAAPAERPVALRRWTVATVAGLLPVVPVVLAGSGQTRQIGWIEPPTWQDLVALPGELFQSAPVGGVVVCLGVLGLAVAGRRAVPLAVWAILPPVLLYLTSDQLNMFLFRYMLFTLPAWALLAAAAVHTSAAGAAAPAVAGGWRRPAVVAAALVVVTVVVLGAEDQRVARQDPLLNHPDYRSAAAVVLAEARPGDGIAYGGRLNGGGNTLRRAMAYELRDAVPLRDVFLAVTPQQRGLYVGAECLDPAPCLGDTRRLWLVTTAWGDDLLAHLPETRRALLEQHFTVVERWQFTRVQVALLERRLEGNAP